MKALATKFLHVWIKPLAINVAGWLLLVVGAAALVLPGPGLICVVGGLAILSLRYRWAERLLHPVKERAFHLASREVQSWPRVCLSLLAGLLLIAAGVVWGLHPPAPDWWQWPLNWWLFGGWGTGLTIILSGVLALSLTVYCYRRFAPSRMQLRR